MVSIIILSYNTRELTGNCLVSLQKNLRGFEHEIIVVDNASTDDSVPSIKKQFPHIKLIESKKNLGFAAGCNLGAMRAKGEQLLFLNSDTELFENTLSKMIRIFKNYPDAGIVGGMLQNKDGTLQRSYASFYTLPNVFQMLFGGEKSEMKRFNDNAVKSVDWVSGGCMMILTRVFTELQGFDEHFFMYVEDMELCYRAKLQGKSVYIDPSSVVLHIGQGSSDRTFAIVNIYKGLQYFYKKHKNRLQYSILLLLLRLKAGLCIVFGLLSGKKKLQVTYIKAWQVL